MGSGTTGLLVIPSGNPVSGTYMMVGPGETNRTTISTMLSRRAATDAGHPNTGRAIRVPG